ncbi:MAG: AI-2E family transporter [Propionivibrio sp.]|uniref:AI-2E family transporter n=1 Tax=Propionivibrio sp. TaxID=2212460 RepID=UPI001A420130|nr:AI-2E family transporter [Propionivibrio sp.]MBL8414980.1 AI-2E family transporter [Propionivibrio sp.]
MTDPAITRADGTGADPATEGAEPAEPSRALLPMPVDVRSVSLAVLATLASVFMLHWASVVLITVCVGLLFSYALSPLVDWLQRRRIPRALSAALLILGLFSGFGAIVYSLSDEASQLIEMLPSAAQKLRDSIHSRSGKTDNALETVQKAATRLEQAAEESTPVEPLGRGVQRVQIDKPRFDIKDHLWNGTLGVLGMLYQIGMVALIAFFLMTSGDSYRAKLVKLAGPALSRKKITLQALNQINMQIQRYLLVQLFTSIVVGVATWLCFLAIGMENAAVWGLAAGLLDLIPYIGNMIVTTGSALMSFLQFGTLEMALLVGLISLAIHSIEAFLLTPWLTSRANKMNPVAIFVGVFAWGWLWGVWGLLLAVPIMVVIKAICDRVDDLKPVGEFLGA